MERSDLWIGKRTCILIFLLIFLQSGTAIGESPQPQETVKSSGPSATGGTFSRIKSFFDDLQTEFTLNTGIRRDDLDWSIAGNSVNVLSELKWSDVESFQISMANRTQFKNNVYGRVDFDYGWILDGTVRDADYGQNNRSAEWSRSISESTGDQVWDLSAGGGYTFYFASDRLAVSPLLGLSYHKQNLRIQNGTQVISGTNPFGPINPPPVGPLSSQLNSIYSARWFGPWIGCDLRFKPKMVAPVHHPMEIRLSLELHWTDYYGKGDWNLRSDLQHPRSFEHEANGFGMTVSGQWLINLTQQWDLTLTASHQDWSTGSGIDRKFLSGGGTTQTRLNKVNWSSTSFTAGATYHF